MINSAKEAKEYLEGHKSKLGNCLCVGCDRAKWYLAALEGEEVKALVDALKKIGTTNGLQYSDIFNLCDEAIFKYYEAIKP